MFKSLNKNAEVFCSFLTVKQYQMCRMKELPEKSWLFVCLRGEGLTQFFIDIMTLKSNTDLEKSWNFALIYIREGSLSSQDGTI